MIDKYLDICLPLHIDRKLSDHLGGGGFNKYSHGIRVLFV